MFTNVDLYMESIVVYGDVHRISQNTIPHWASDHSMESSIEVSDEI